METITLKKIINTENPVNNPCIGCIFYKMDCLDLPDLLECVNRKEPEVNHIWIIQ